MLRRRHKNPKTHPKARAVVPAAGSRRRARPDAPVPEHLKTPDAPPPQPPRAPSPRGGAPLVLVTGFEPFEGEDTNPSWEVCKLLPAAIGRARIEKLKVPCDFRRAIETVAHAIERSRPALVICIGQAAGRPQLCMERVGINIDDARVPDNTGAQPIDEAIAPNGPPAYFATLPIKAMVKAARDAGVPAEVSNTAGTYVCNHLLYGVLHYIAASGLDARAGFIHVPYAEHQVVTKPGQPSMPVATMARGVEAAIVAALEHTHDMKISEGKET
jgi:pyroglutamyl-peptidase